MAVLIEAIYRDGTPASHRDLEDAAQRTFGDRDGLHQPVASLRVLDLDRHALAVSVSDDVAERIVAALNQNTDSSLSFKISPSHRSGRPDRRRLTQPTDLLIQYARGGCFEFATALNDLTGLPIEVMRDGWSQAPIHAYVSLDADRGLDIRGVQPKEEIAEEHDLGFYTVQQLAPQEAVNPGDADESALLEAAEAARATIDAVNDLLPSARSHDEALARSGFWGDRGAGVLLRARDTGRIMLIERQFSLEAGTWGMLGGAVDANEMYIEAALRELTEETGVCNTDIDLADVTRLYRFHDPQSSTPTRTSSSRPTGKSLRSISRRPARTAGSTRLIHPVRFTSVFKRCCAMSPAGKPSQTIATPRV